VVHGTGQSAVCKGYVTIGALTKDEDLTLKIQKHIYILGNICD
jgi:hypothetical protein